MSQKLSRLLSLLRPSAPSVLPLKTTLLPLPSRKRQSPVLGSGCMYYTYLSFECDIYT